jgi:branched-chain amino acid transport system ATP-binding protein
MTPLLEVSDLAVSYGEFQALFGVSLEVARGETVAIIGANGAGKSTLLRTIAGALTPGSGAIRFAGKSLPTGAHAVNAHGVALVPEGRKIFPSLSVEENLRVGAFARRSGPWTIDSVFQLFPVLHERRSAPGTLLSGGQQQMLAIGRALMSNPELLLLDELSLGLAPVIINELYGVVARIAREGCTVVIVEQDIRRSLSAAQHVYCLLEGRISLSGRPSELDHAAIASAYFGITAGAHP